MINENTAKGQLQCLNVFKMILGVVNYIYRICFNKKINLKCIYLLVSPLSSRHSQDWFGRTDTLQVRWRARLICASESTVAMCLLTKVLIHGYCPWPDLCFIMTYQETNQTVGEIHELDFGRRLTNKDRKTDVSTPAFPTCTVMSELTPRLPENLRCGLGVRECLQAWK